MRTPIFLLFTLIISSHINSQMITGVWHGRINRQKVEVKIIQNGDSLAGTSYYYESSSNYRRYSIKGFFHQQTNTTVWWDDALIEEKTGKFSITSPGKIPLLSQADFNCPGGDKMMLDGVVSKKDAVMVEEGEVHLVKGANLQFEDEWDFIIENYTVGANDPDLIDSVALISFNKKETPPIAEPIFKKIEPSEAPLKKEVERNPVKETVVENKLEKLQPVYIPPIPPPAIEEKFVKREKKFVKEIPVSGDSIELRFYDNAEIDGDSISLFLNGQLLKANIRLAAKPYILKLALADLEDSNELVMVAENLGTIPPNTSYMVVMVNDVKHDAYLASSEGSSAMIRLKKE